ncbi:MAG: hypothetical protein CMO44_13265 [Verrucomicrobiales bacterium]|nr:hypothetical protein [Verrucomicrobiales bacterium]
MMMNFMKMKIKMSFMKVSAIKHLIVQHDQLVMMDHYLSASTILTLTFELIIMYYQKVGGMGETTG